MSGLFAPLRDDQARPGRPTPPTHPSVATPSPMSKGKVDVSFIKHVATNDDFQREVVDHGMENLLVGAPRRQ